MDNKRKASYASFSRRWRKRGPGDKKGDLGGTQLGTVQQIGSELLQINRNDTTFRVFQCNWFKGNVFWQTNSYINMWF